MSCVTLVGLWCIVLLIHVPTDVSGGYRLKRQENNNTSYECGVNADFAFLVVNGTKTVIDEFPWLVAMFYYNNGQYEYRCAGTLVTNMHIVTAAHCFRDRAGTQISSNNVAFALGKTNLDNWTMHSAVRGVEKVTIHPTYSRSSDGDLAMVKMNATVKFSNTINPICLWPDSDVLDNIIGDQGIVAGWGRDETDARQVSEPRKVSMPVVAQEDCIRSDERFFRATSNTTFCAGYRNGSSPCTGDSGSGFVMKRNRKWFLRGVVSTGLVTSGTRTCDSRHYVVFVDVAKFTQWLVDNLDGTLILIEPIGPDPLSKLSVTVRSGKAAAISWSPPSQGRYSYFKLKIKTLTKSLDPKPRTITIDDVDATSYVLTDLTPGATYQVQAYTVFENKESADYISRNFTTIPNTPGKLTVWFRNETALLVLWQPPFPPAIYTRYKVSIDPPDAIDSVLYVEEEGDPPNPGPAAFKELIPGRPYNISIQTMSEDEISIPTIAQYRTVPLRPRNIRFDNASITSGSFVVRWDPPIGKGEFDKYQIVLNKLAPVTKLREEPTEWEFKDNLEPGKTYQVVVKTMSGKLASRPLTGNITLPEG